VSRVIGMVAGSITFSCAAHSAATASASALSGSASVRFIGVFAVLPSSSTTTAPSRSPTLAC
jgi:hypothetical protein